MKRKRIIYFLIPLICGICRQNYAQSVTISPTNNTAILNVQSTTKGFLPPQLNETQRNNMTGLVAGVIVYCTDCTVGAGAYSFNGTSWVPMFVPASTLVGPSFTVGQSKFGGVIFYVDDSGQHGLVASLADQSTSTKWFNGNFTNTLAIRSGIYSGFYNTERINSNQNVGTYAASIAAQTTNGGFGDWYLPSKDELMKMFQQIAVIPAISAGSAYWGSTEETAAAGATSLNAYQVILSTGASSLSSKSTSARVRAIRRF
ncbi:hypothetical protein [Emticicia sp. SJ17W-69]|uniref:hypothetical protein n=1 Tax=Emticicia sp. SJ17W-69 TaxID=3421657 RepID=UPI003EBC3EBD